VSGGQRGIVAAGHPLTCAAAAGILRAGGNAFDAALAAGFAASLTEPMLTSLGGGGFLLAHPADGEGILIDFFSDAPGRGRPDLEPHLLPMTVSFSGTEQVFNIGFGSVAVPGTLAGLLHCHSRFARLPLADIVAPAVRLAREGVTLNAQQAYALGLLVPIHALTERGRALYSPEGRTPCEGERLVNPELADYLEALPRDRGRGLYGGALAQQVGHEMDAGQGLLTAEDLAAYRVIERAPLRFEYRDRCISTNPPPSFGGTLVALALRMLGGLGEAPPRGSVEHALRLAAVMEELEAVRDRAVADPALEAALADSLGRLCASGGTTHVSVCDAEGNAASMTLSNGEGSGYVVPGTGIMLNNMLGEDDLNPEGIHARVPGERVASMMAPTIVEHDGAIDLVLGSGGSKRIRTALVQVIGSVVDYGLPIVDAVAAPRLHWDGERLQIEPGVAPEIVAALERRWPVNLWEERSLYFGGVHAIAVREAAAAGDSRRGGAVSIVAD